MLFFFKLFFWLCICHVRKMTSSWPCFITKNTRLPSNSRRLACETTFWRSRCFCHYHRTLTTAFGYMKPSTHEFIVQSLNDHDTPRKHLCNYRPVSSVKARWTWVMRETVGICELQLPWLVSTSPIMRAAFLRNTSDASAHVPAF